MKKKLIILLIIALIALFGCKTAPEDDNPVDSTSDATADTISDPTTDTEPGPINDPGPIVDPDPDPTTDTDPIIDPDPVPTPILATMEGLNHIDLSEAKSAVVTKSSVAIAHNYKWWNPIRYLKSIALADQGDITKLFKVTEAGYFQEVYYEQWTWPYNPLTDPTSDQYDPEAVDATEDAIITQVLTGTNSPVAVVSVNQDYSVVFFETPGTVQYGLNYAIENAEYVYLVNNTTGVSKSIIEYGNPLPPPNYYIDAPMFIESSGQVFYIAQAFGEGGRRQVVKFDPTTLEVMVMTPIEDHVVYFEVDDSGNIIYEGYNNQTIENHAVLVKTNGDIYIIRTGNLTTNFWKATNGKLHYFRSSNAYGDHDIIEIDVDEDFNVIESFYIENTEADVSSAWGCRLIKTKDRILIANSVTPDIDGDLEFVEVENASKTILKFKWKDIDISEIDAVTTDDDNIFIAGTNLTGKKVLKKLSKTVPLANRLGSISNPFPIGFNPPQLSIVGGNTVEDLFIPDEYSITKMVSNGSGGIVFAGTQLLPDAKKVIAERDSVGTVTIFETGSNAETLALAKLN